MGAELILTITELNNPGINGVASAREVTFLDAKITYSFFKLNKTYLVSDMLE